MANGPDIDRFAWYSAVVGGYIIPTNDRGSIVVDIVSSQKIDAKASAGKDKAVTTQQGVQATKGSIEWEFAAADWPDGPDGPGVESTLTYLDPNGPQTGGPFLFSHPDGNWRGLGNIMVVEIEAVKWKGHHGSTKIKWEEWNPKKPDKSGASGTPADPDAGTGGDSGDGSATKTPAAAKGYAPGQKPGPSPAVPDANSPAVPARQPFNPARNPSAPNALPSTS
jgi:hypothetical protein